MTTTTHNQELVNYALNGMDNINPGTYGCYLQHKIFNTGYFIIGYYAAEQWLINNVGIFAAIGEVVKYEKDNFGEVTTDIESSKNFVNIFAYIKGEEILQDCPTLQRKWNDRLTNSDISKIKKELNNLIG